MLYCVITAFSVLACCCFVLNMTPNNTSSLLSGYPWESLFVLTHCDLFYAGNSSHNNKWRQSLARRFSSPCCLLRSNTCSCLASPGSLFFFFFKYSNVDRMCPNSWIQYSYIVASQWNQKCDAFMLGALCVSINLKTRKVAIGWGNESNAFLCSFYA